MEWIDTEGANHMGSFETSKENSIYIEDEIKARKQFLRFTIVPIVVCINYRANSKYFHRWKHLLAFSLHIVAFYYNSLSPIFQSVV